MFLFDQSIKLMIRKKFPVKPSLENLGKNSATSTPVAVLCLEMASVQGNRAAVATASTATPL